MAQMIKTTTIIMPKQRIMIRVIKKSESLLYTVIIV